MMGECWFNLRIGKLHIQIVIERKELRLSINDYHKWLARPFIKLYDAPWLKEGDE